LAINPAGTIHTSVRSIPKPVKSFQASSISQMETSNRIERLFSLFGKQKVVGAERAQLPFQLHRQLLVLKPI